MYNVHYCPVSYYVLFFNSNHKENHKVINNKETLLKFKENFAKKYIENIRGFKNFKKI